MASSLELAAARCRRRSSATLMLQVERPAARNERPPKPVVPSFRRTRLQCHSVFSDSDWWNDRLSKKSAGEVKVQDERETGKAGICQDFVEVGRSGRSNGLAQCNLLRLLWEPASVLEQPALGLRSLPSPQQHRVHGHRRPTAMPFTAESRATLHMPKNFRPVFRR